METPSGKREITVFADYVCPFSYLSLLGLERLAAEFKIEVHWRAFELRSAPALMLEPFTDAEWQMVQAVAADAGAELQRPLLRPRTRKAHEAVKFAATQGAEQALRRAIFDAHFVHGRDIGRIDVLTAIAAGVGVDRMAIRVGLDVDAHAAEVVADENLAERFEIEGTPAFVAGSDIRVGYLSADHLREWLKD